MQKNRNKQKGKKAQAAVTGMTIAPPEVLPVQAKNTPPLLPKAQDVTTSAPLDPHLARLLTNLAQSSLTAPPPKAEPQPAPVETAEVVSGAKPTINHGSTAAPDQHHLDEPSAQQVPLPHLGGEPVGPSVSAAILQPAEHLPKEVVALSNPNNVPKTLDIDSDTPTSPLHSARRSSTADISPYLSRAVEVPSSAKRLKQLSLLESVADESARMAPLIAARAAMASRGPAPNSYPQPSPSVPPQPIAMQHGMHGIPSVFSGPAYKFPNQYPNQMLEHDHYQLRSRTSQAIHRGPAHNVTGSVNIKQNQLLNTLNNARGIPMDASFPPLHQPRPMMDPSQFHLPPPHMIQQPPLSTGPTNLSFPNPHPQLHILGVNHLPNGIPIPPIPPHNMPPSSHNPSTVSLLSILNGKPNHMNSFPPSNGLR